MRHTVAIVPSNAAYSVGSIWLVMIHVSVVIGYQRSVEPGVAGRVVWTDTVQRGDTGWTLALRTRLLRGVGTIGTGPKTTPHGRARAK